MEVGGDQQGETDDPKRRAAFLALAALSERGAFVEGVDKSEEIRGVEQDSLQIDVDLAHHVRHEVSPDGDDRLVRHPVHVVPKALAGELPRTQEKRMGAGFARLSAQVAQAASARVCRRRR